MTREEAKQIALKLCKPYPEPGDFRRFILPRIISVAVNQTLDLREIMAVQPMDEPSGQVFYLDFVRDSWWERFKRWIKYRRRLHLCWGCAA